MMQKPSKKLEQRKVKGTVVTSKDGETFFRKEHQRKMEVNVDKNQLLLSTLTNKLTRSDIVSSQALDIAEAGISPNVLKLIMDDGKGNTLHSYFKGITGDTFVTKANIGFVTDLHKISKETGDKVKSFLRPSVTLNDRKTEEQLS